MSAVLEVKNLTKVFSLGSLFSRLRIKAVDQISFTVKPAEIFTLAGESGCGKTTTARMILGFEPPTSGEIRYQNRKIEEFQDKKPGLKKYKQFFKILLKPLIPYVKWNAISLRLSTTIS